MSELKEIKASIAALSKTDAELRAMPTSALICRLSIIASDLKDVQEDMKSIKNEIDDEDGEDFADFAEIVKIQNDNLIQVAAEIDVRIPVPA